MNQRNLPEDPIIREIVQHARAAQLSRRALLGGAVGGAVALSLALTIGCGSTANASPISWPEGDELYGIGVFPPSQHTVLRFDVPSGVNTVGAALGTPVTGESIDLLAATYNPVSDKAYWYDGAAYYEFDFATNTAVKLGNYPGSALGNGLECLPTGVCYTLDSSNKLAIVDIVADTQTPVTGADAVPGISYKGLAYDPVTDLIYVFPVNQADASWGSIDPETGRYQAVLPDLPLAARRDAAFDSDGTMWTNDTNNVIYGVVPGGVTGAQYTTKNVSNDTSFFSFGLFAKTSATDTEDDNAEELAPTGIATPTVPLAIASVFLLTIAGLVVRRRTT